MIQRNSNVYQPSQLAKWSVTATLRRAVIKDIQIRSIHKFQLLLDMVNKMA